MLDSYTGGRALGDEKTVCSVDVFSLDGSGALRLPLALPKTGTAELEAGNPEPIGRLDSDSVRGDVAVEGSLKQALALQEMLGIVLLLPLRPELVLPLVVVALEVLPVPWPWCVVVQFPEIGGDGVG